MEGHISNDVRVVLIGQEFRKIINLKSKLVFHFYFFYIMDISVTIEVINLNFSMCILNQVLLQGRKFQIFDTGHSSCFMPTIHFFTV